MYLTRFSAEFFDDTPDLQWSNIRHRWICGWDKRNESSIDRILWLYHGNESLKGWKNSIEYVQAKEKRIGRKLYGHGSIEHAQFMVNWLESEIEFYRYGELVPSGD